MLLLLSFVSIGQDSVPDVNIGIGEEEEAYNYFMNYTPLQYKSSLGEDLNGRFNSMNISCLSMLKMLYGYHNVWQFTDEELKQLEGEINHFITALYLEGKPVIIKKVGGYDGCPDEMVYRDNFNNAEVTVLNFCYTCNGGSQAENKFISIVNSRTEELLGINK